MMMTTMRQVWRWALAGGGLLAVGMLVGASGSQPVLAADLGDTFSADVGGPRTGTTLKGRGHTFDDKPYRHPQSLRSRPDHPEPFDRHAYRDDDTVHRYDQPYDDQAYRDAPTRGSLKDDGVPYSEAPRYGYRERDEERTYSHRYNERWDDDWRRPVQCISKRRLRRQLRRAGWRGFRRGRVRGNIGYVVARQRGTGEIYELAVDRCTGEVISQSCLSGGDRGFRRRGVRFGDYREDVVIRW